MTRLIALTLALAACGGEQGTTIDAMLVDVPGDAVPREVITENVPLVVTEVAEAIMPGGAGDYARIRLTTSPLSASLDWNIHGHANGETQVVQEGYKQESVDYLFVPTATADWYLLLRNKGQTDINVELNIELYGNITWSGWQ